MKDVVGASGARRSGSQSDLRQFTRTETCRANLQEPPAMSCWRSFLERSNGWLLGQAVRSSRDHVDFALCSNSFCRSDVAAGVPPDWECCALCNAIAFMTTRFESELVSDVVLVKRQRNGSRKAASCCGHRCADVEQDLGKVC
jgi:hypothetical protein